MHAVGGNHHHIAGLQRLVVTAGELQYRSAGIYSAYGECRVTMRTVASPAVLGSPAFNIWHGVITPELLCAHDFSRPGKTGCILA